MEVGTGQRKRIVIDIEKDKAIHFMETEKGYLLTLHSNGCIYSEGRMIVEDKDLVDTLRVLESLLKGQFNM